MKKTFMSTKIKLFFKLTFVIGIFIYLSSSNLLDFSKVFSAFRNLGFIALLILLYVMGILISVYRWKVVLSSIGFNYDFKEVLRLQCVGLFFSTFLPGALGGDLIRGYYIVSKEEEKNKKFWSFFTVFIDRMVGLYALATIVTLTLVFKWDILNSYRQLFLLSVVTAGVVVSIFVVCILFLFVKESQILKLTLLVERFFKTPDFLTVFFLNIKKVLPHLGKAYFVSFGIQVLAIFMYYFGALALGYQEMKLEYFCFIVPFGSLVMALPLTPAGLGVGQAAFLVLFSWIKVDSSFSGADLCTLIQLITLLFNFMIGGYFYVRFKRGSIKMKLDTPSLMSPLPS